MFFFLVLDDLQLVSLEFNQLQEQCSLLIIIEVQLSESYTIETINYFIFHYAKS